MASFGCLHSPSSRSPSRLGPFSTIPASLPSSSFVRRHFKHSWQSRSLWWWVVIFFSSLPAVFVLVFTFHGDWTEWILSIYSTHFLGFLLTLRIDICPAAFFRTFRTSRSMQIVLKYRKVTRPGIEPRTFWTYTRCSNQLSYLALEINQLILYLCNCQPKDTYSARHIQCYFLHARSTLWPWYDQISQSGNHVTDYIIQFQQT